MQPRRPAPRPGEDDYVPHLHQGSKGAEGKGKMKGEAAKGVPSKGPAPSVEEARARLAGKGPHSDTDEADNAPNARLRELDEEQGAPQEQLAQPADHATLEQLETSSAEEEGYEVVAATRSERCRWRTFRVDRSAQREVSSAQLRLIMDFIDEALLEQYQNDRGRMAEVFREWDRVRCVHVPPVDLLHQPFSLEWRVSREIRRASHHAIMLVRRRHQPSA